MAKEIAAKSRAQMIVDYPLEQGVDGWFFRQQEVSAGAYLVEGSDCWGRKVSRTGGDPDALLNECVMDARAICAQVNRAH